MRPWDLWDRPFVHATEDLGTFLLFLEDGESREYEISCLTANSLTLRLSGPEGSSVLYTSNALKLHPKERYRLFKAFESSPSVMPRFVREKLAAHAGLFLGLKLYRR